MTTESGLGAAVADALASNGVDTVFGIPGTHNLELYAGLSRSSIRHVTARHEQGAAYAADGYARASGRPGVVFTTSGPGILNALVGVGNAYADSVPLLVISPGPPRGTEGTDIAWLHGMKDQHAAADGVAQSTRVQNAQQAINIITGAFAAWRVGRKRPVLLEIPIDVLGAYPVLTATQPVADAQPPAVTTETLANIVAVLQSAQRVAVIVGGGCVDAGTSVREVVDLIGAIVVSTLAGRGVVSEKSPLVAGDFADSPRVGAALADFDVVLALGTELQGLRRYASDFAPTVIRVDIDAGPVLLVDRPVDIHVTADVDAFCRALSAQLPPEGLAELTGVTGAESARRMRAAYLADVAQRCGAWRGLNEELSASVPASTIVTGDSSQITYYGTSPFWSFEKPRQFLKTIGFATLGYALPAAIGAKLAKPESPVIAMLGDGAFMFSAPELMTAVELRLPLPIIIGSNGGYREIEEQMVGRGERPIGVRLREPDYALFAQAMGCRGVVVGEDGDAATLVAEAFATDRPTVIVMRE